MCVWEIPCGNKIEAAWIPGQPPGFLEQSYHLALKHQPPDCYTRGNKEINIYLVSVTNLGLNLDTEPVF